MSYIRRQAWAADANARRLAQFDAEHPQFRAAYDAAVAAAKATFDRDIAALRGAAAEDLAGRANDVARAFGAACDAAQLEYAHAAEQLAPPRGRR